MIFDHDTLQFTLYDVLYFDESDVTTRIKERAFCALSLRFSADTDIMTKARTHHLTDGDLTFFPANLAYTRKSKHDRMIVFHFAVQNYVSYDVEVLSGMAEECAGIFTSAFDEWRRKAPGYQYRVSAMLYELFAKLHAGRTASGDHVRYSETVARAIGIMKAHYADPSLSIASLAADAHMSDTYFRRIFGREVGVSPKQYLTDLRFERAQSLLNAGYDTVASVAEKTGFGDAKNFATAFRRRFGYPPSGQKYAP